MDQPGFHIGNDFYEFPTKFRLGDPVLVAEVTGMAWNDFAELLDSGDPRTLAGLVAVAIWQKQPTWRRERVLRHVEGLELDALEFTGADDVEEALPQSSAGGPDTTPGSPATSTPFSATPEPSDGTPAPTGLQLSEISAA